MRFTGDLACRVKTLSLEDKNGIGISLIHWLSEYEKGESL